MPFHKCDPNPILPSVSPMLLCAKCHSKVPLCRKQTMVADSASLGGRILLSLTAPTLSPCPHPTNHTAEIHLKAVTVLCLAVSKPRWEPNHHANSIRKWNWWLGRKGVTPTDRSMPLLQEWAGHMETGLNLDFSGLVSLLCSSTTQHLEVPARLSALCFDFPASSQYISTGCKLQLITRYAVLNTTVWPENT